MASHSDNGEFGFQIAPMLDVLFVLLLFFMVSAGSLKREAQIVTRLPGNGAPPLAAVQVNIDIDENGQVLFNGVPTDSPANHDLPETTARLKAALADLPDHPVIVTPSPTTRQQRVMDVLSMCKGMQVKNLAFGSTQ